MFMPDSPSSPDSPDLAAKLLENMRGAIPLSIEQIDMMLRLLTAARGEGLENFLVLGSGHGLLSAAILGEFPAARGYLVAGSEAALAVARLQLQPHAGRVGFILADEAAPGWLAGIAHAGPFDAVVSALAAPPLSADHTRARFTETFRLLQPGGLFLNIEHVASATRWTESVCDDYLIDAIFGRELRAGTGHNRAEIARDYFARAGQHAGASAPLEVQCDWLRETGFENVECFLKVQELAVFGGQRPARDGV